MYPVSEPYSELSYGDKGSIFPYLIGLASYYVLY